MTGTLHVVATPLGNLGDMGARAVETLKAVALIACEDTRTTRTLLARHAITTRTVALHAHNERAAAAKLIALLREGRMPINEIALATGFAHQSHLARHMCRLLGVTPAEVKRQA